MCCGFPKDAKNIKVSSINDGSAHTKCSCLPNNTIVHTILEKLKTNPIFMKVNKFKPYCLFDDPTIRLVVISQR